MVKENVTTNLEGLLNRLEKQYKYLSNGGTSYRLETARLSLHIAKQVMEFEPFLSQKTTRDIVGQSLGNTNKERVEDVTKMLYLNAKVQYRKANESPEFRAAVRERMANRKALKLVKQ